MTLPAAGPISFGDINAELGLSAAALISLNDAAVRTLAGVASGAIDMAALRGKTNAFAFAITTNQTNSNLRSLAVAAGWNQVLPVAATIASGVVISGSVVANATAALTIDGSWPGGVTLINNGTIAGMGGTGGAGGNNSPGATTGGRAVLAAAPVTINNAGGIIAGGGTGGNGAARVTGTYYWENSSSGNSGTGTMSAGGGGGGGGRGGNIPSVGGARGSLSSSTYGWGVQILHSDPTAGAAGTLGAAGAGGQGGYVETLSLGVRSDIYAGSGGVGADWGVGGQCVSGNSFVTWSAVGARYGALV